VEDLIQVQDQFSTFSPLRRGQPSGPLSCSMTTRSPCSICGATLPRLGRRNKAFITKARGICRSSAALERPRPLLLSARVKEDNELFGADLTNPDSDRPRRPRPDAGHSSISFAPDSLWSDTWHERIRLCNYGRAPLPLTLAFDLDADFADILRDPRRVP